MISKLLLLLLIPFGAIAQVSDETRNTLREAAENFVLSQIDADPATRVLVTAGPIDSRLPLTTCQDKLQISLPGNMTIRRNTTVLLACQESPGWNVYLPVRVSLQKPFVTVTDIVAKGDLLSADKLTLAYQDEQMMRGDYLVDPTPLIGSRSKRDIRPGQPIRASQICVICKGDQITLIAQTSNLQIKSMVRALQDGSFGDMIRVTNLQSGREVSAKVSGVGSAVINMQ